ncbi:hypothetical protein [Laspinema palackyanum]
MVRMKAIADCTPGKSQSWTYPRWDEQPGIVVTGGKFTAFSD